MTGNTFASLIHAARKRMRRSNDPVHDMAHAERTARYVAALCKETRVETEHAKALAIAAWWHDAARTITDNPSFVWMPCIDDLLSAIILWWHTVRTRTQSRTTGLAVRLIACKSMGAGAFLTKILLRKRLRILVDILEDADTLDVFTVDRFSKVLTIIETSRMYRLGYRINCRWYCFLRHIKMRTEPARRYIARLLGQFIAWIKQPAIYFWHVRHFGEAWAKKTLHRFETLHRRLTMEVSFATL